MDAYEYLSQAKLLDHQIQSKLSQLESLKSLATSAASCCGNREPIVKHSRNVSAMEDTILKIIEAEKELNAQIDELVDLKLEISRTIAQVKDVTLRLILEKHFLAFQSLKDIGRDLGFGKRWMQIKYKMAVAAVQTILEREESG
ncbi:MAG: hypothetical protein IJK06_06630 [Clostridia bacterium]|nr:hypothetical protein [Clostridia bacterium]